jgi:hypothetical protein
MVWLEPTTNPTLKMTDIRAVCEMAKKKNPKILIGVDNTFCSPYFLVDLLNTYLIFKNYISKLKIDLKNRFKEPIRDRR